MLLFCLFLQTVGHFENEIHMANVATNPCKSMHLNGSMILFLNIFYVNISQYVWDIALRVVEFSNGVHN